MLLTAGNPVVADCPLAPVIPAAQTVVSPARRRLRSRLIVFSYNEARFSQVAAVRDATMAATERIVSILVPLIHWSG
jgi:hypothetical protein